MKTNGNFIKKKKPKDKLMTLIFAFHQKNVPLFILLPMKSTTFATQTR